MHLAMDAWVVWHSQAPKFDIDAGLDAKIKSELFINPVDYAFFQALIL